MTNDTQTLTEFLRARIAEEAQYWEAADASGLVVTSHLRGDAASSAPTANWVKQRVAECEAKRQIVASCSGRLALAKDDDSTEAAWVAQFADETLWSLAFPYSDHPDFREDWRP